ncbi:hypothetical protein FJZ19_05220 [Candidatus Pacearchaeota archaeon]|nr:hypothetical protein [Candidatus Pacearchaeota archaeon]
MVVFTYLVSRDLVETLERKVGFELSKRTKRGVNGLEDRFLQEFWQYIPPNICRLDIRALNVSQQIQSALSQYKFPVISLDRVYVPNAQDYLEVTRQTNPQTGEVRIAERPGSLPLKEQAKKMKKYKKIILVDVGAFEGTTLLDISNLLSKEGVEIEEIVLGISSNDANSRLKEARKVTVLNLFNFYDWIELRDLIGIDGRNTGIKNGRREFIPYWENLCKWATISPENREAVAKVCKRFNIQLVGRLWQEGYDLSKLGRPVKYIGK